MQMPYWNSELRSANAVPLWVFLVHVLRDTIIKRKVKLHGQLAEPLLLECENILLLEKEGIGEARQSWGPGDQQALVSWCFCRELKITCLLFYVLKVRNPTEYHRAKNPGLDRIGSLQKPQETACLLFFVFDSCHVPCLVALIRIQWQRSAGIEVLTVHHRDLYFSNSYTNKDCCVYSGSSCVIDGHLHK